jgi:putative phosphoesterase
MKTVIFSDVHSNFAAMEGIFRQEKSWDRVIFLGDALLFGPQPDEVLSELRNLGALCLMGNHDREVLNPESFHDSGYPEHRNWLNWTIDRISRNNLRFVEQSFQPALNAEIDGLEVRLHHGEFTFPSGTRLFPDSSDADFETAARMFPEKIIITGHSHVQCDIERQGKRFINPGSAGHARLGQPVSCYLVIEDGAVILKAAPYDIEKTAEKMESLPLPEDFKNEWIRSFRTGTIAPRYDFKDFSALKAAGYR